jgi:thioredoxin 1
MPDIHNVTKDTFAQQVLSAKGLLMIYYYAPWCKPCQDMDDVIQTAANEVQSKMSIFKINTDQEGEITAQQKIFVIPCCQVFKDGKLLQTFRGSLSKLELLAELSHIVTDEAQLTESNAGATP